MTKPIRFLGLVLAANFIACGNDNGGDVVDAGTGMQQMDASDPTMDAGCDVDPTFSSLHMKIFSTAMCASSSCHGTSNDLTLSGNAAAAHAEVMGATVDGTARGAGFTQRVVAMQPDQSFFYLKLITDTPPGGSRMPQVCEFIGTCLTDCQQAAVRTWILNGANND